MKYIYRILWLSEAQQKELGTYSQVLSFLESVEDSVTDQEIREKYCDITVKIFKCEVR
jgi:hypothetical protein